MRSVSHTAEKWAWLVLAAASCAVIWIWALSGCAHTVAPKAVVAHEIAYDGNVQNAGLIDCDASGCLVTPGWIGRYRALEKSFQHTVPADDLITTEGQNYRVPFEVSNNFAEMRMAERGP